MQRIHNGIDTYTYRRYKRYKAAQVETRRAASQPDARPDEAAQLLLIFISPPLRLHIMPTVNVDKERLFDALGRSYSTYRSPHTMIPDSSACASVV